MIDSNGLELDYNNSDYDERVNLLVLLRVYTFSQYIAYAPSCPLFIIKIYVLAPSKLSSRLSAFGTHLLDPLSLSHVVASGSPYA